MPKKIINYFYVGIFILLSSCSQHNMALHSPKEQYRARTKSKNSNVLRSSKHYYAKGLASWYGPGFHKKRTSSGERYNMYQLTAAHKTLPLDTYVQVTNLNNGKQVIVKINDRGPYVQHRLIDLSYAAAKKIGMVRIGTTPVVIKTIRSV